MGFFTRDIKTIDDLFAHALRDIYYAEHQIMQSLPDMIDKAHDPQLKQRLHAHLGETINHIDRLEDVFSLYGTDPRHLNCPAIDGIIAEAKRTRRRSTRRSSRPRRRSSITRSRATARSSPGQSGSTETTARRSSSRTLRKSRPPTSASPSLPSATRT